jgi:hypothetical protein
VIEPTVIEMNNLRRKARFYSSSHVVHFHQAAERLSGFAAEKLVFIFTAAVGAAEAAEQ